MRKKLKKLRKNNKNLERELKEIEEQSKVEKLLQSYITTRDCSTQTEKTGRVPLRLTTTKKIKKEEKEDESTNRLLSLHDILMRRYEKEVRTNTQHMETISSLMIKINELEQELLKAQQQNRIRDRNTPTPKKRRRRKLDDSLDLRTELQKIKKDRDQILKQKKKLSSELKGLDEGFFEEIEDLKFALQESAKLNKEYEKALEKICTQFGVPLPLHNKTSSKSPYKRTSTRASHRPGSC
ncbi:uncharacterized protein [Antedon mediterranea]